MFLLVDYWTDSAHPSVATSVSSFAYTLMSFYHQKGCCSLVHLLNGNLYLITDTKYYVDRPGQATETDSCDVITSVPLQVAEDMDPFGLGTFYQKYTEAYGIPVICKYINQCAHLRHRINELSNRTSQNVKITVSLETILFVCLNCPNLEHKL